jgi:tetratricopeptide (TPR) repeat protein
MRALLSGVDQVNEGLDNLNATASDTLDAVADLSSLLGRSLRHISQQIVAQQETLDEIATLLRRPYQTRARELRDEGEKWLLSGMGRKGRERDEDWNDAMRLLNATTDNNLGMQDYVVFFQMGWLLWKHDHNVAAAEAAFYRAQRLSSGGHDLYHLLSLRHLAYMQFLLEKHQDAYDTIHQALDVSRDHDTMYDAARYSVNAERGKEAIAFLDKCIDMQPTTIVTMFSEPDLKSVLTGLLRLAARKLQEIRQRAENNRKRCQLVLQGAADAEKLLALKFVSLRAFTTDVETIGQRLGKADYLTSLELEKRIL